MAESTDGDIGFDTLIELETAPGSNTFEALGEVTNLSGVGQSQGAVDVTHMQSPDGMREWRPGLGEQTDLTIDMNWAPGGTADARVRAWMAARELRKIRITWASGERRTSSAFPTDYSGETPLDDKMTSSLTVKQSGSPVWDEAP